MTTLTGGDAVEAGPDGKESVPAYVAFKACGCAVAVIVDTPDYKREVRKAIASWLRDDLTIERKTVGWARKNLHFCDCDKVTGVAP